MTEQPTANKGGLKVIDGSRAEPREGEFLDILSGMLDPDQDNSAKAFDAFDQLADRVAPRGRSHMIRVK